MRTIVLVGALSAMLATAVWAPPAAPADLRGYWKLDEKPSPSIPAKDSSTGMHNGKVSGNVTQVAPGPCGTGESLLVRIERPSLGFRSGRESRPGAEADHGRSVGKGRGNTRPLRLHHRQGLQLHIRFICACTYASYALYTVDMGHVAFYVGSGGSFYRSQIADSKDAGTDNGIVSPARTTATSCACAWTASRRVQGLYRFRLHPQVSSTA